MKLQKEYVYVITGEFNSEDDNDDFCHVISGKEEALNKFQQLVKEEKESDFVKGHQTDEGDGTYYETFCNFLDETDSYLMGCYNFGSTDNSFYTKIILRKVEVE